MPKDIHVEPQKFAAQLISKLETVLREREAQERLEERLKRVRLVSKAPPRTRHRTRPHHRSFTRVARVTSDACRPLEMIHVPQTGWELLALVLQMKLLQCKWCRLRLNLICGV